MDPFISGGWSDDEFELDNSSAVLPSTSMIDSGGADDQDDVGPGGDFESNRCDDGGGQEAYERQNYPPFDQVELQASFDGHRGDAAGDNENHAQQEVGDPAYHRDGGTTLEGPGQTNNNNFNDDRLALVGVINHDDSIRVQVLATPPHKPPRLPPLASPSSSITARFNTARGPSQHARRMNNSSSDSHPPADDESMLKLQETSVQKREERAETMRSIGAKIAHATAQVANENLQREGSIRDLHGRLGRLVEESMDRMALRQDVLHNRVEQIHKVEVRLTRMDAGMTKALHADTCAHLQGVVGSLQKRADDLSSARQRRNDACLSSDAAAFRTMDRVTADLRRHWLEERCSRMAAVELAGYQIQERDWDPNASRQYLEHIQDLRDQIRHERLERQRNDATVKDRIARATSSLKRAMLHLAVDAPYEDGVSEEVSMLNVDVDEHDEAMPRSDYLGV
jgi:hypothetical protein